MYTFNFNIVFKGEPAKDSPSRHHNYRMQEPETRMTASVLKQDPKKEKVQKNAYLLGHKHTICK